MREESPAVNVLVSSIDALGELVDFRACFMVELVDALGELGQGAAELAGRNPWST